MSEILINAISVFHARYRRPSPWRWSMRYGETDLHFVLCHCEKEGLSHLRAIPRALPAPSPSNASTATTPELKKTFQAAQAAKAVTDAKDGIR